MPLSPGSAPPSAPLDADPAVAAAVERLRRRNPRADPLARLPGVHPARIPRHVAVIMDGNGRWAEGRGMPRMVGHRYGAEAVRRLVEEAGRLGIECLTLYSFSLENWKRPAREVEALMGLCLEYLAAEQDLLLREDVRLRVIGRRDGLPAPVLDAVAATLAATARCASGTLCLALNYAGRAEIADAARKLAERAARGEVRPDQVDEAALAACLYAPDLPEPDLVIRTAGEMRLSNFLLWQLAYAELHVTATLWPDFDAPDLHAAVRDYASRERRFGGVGPMPGGPGPAPAEPR